jgi:hypothetical protein
MLVTELYQKLSPWLCAPVDRANRAYLETHLELLGSEYESFLAALMGEYANDPREQQRLRLRQQLLHDARVRGGTKDAVRESFVNVFGGLILDLPSWLMEVEEELNVISGAGLTQRAIALRKLRIKDAIEQAQSNSGIAPESVAELQYRLASVFAYDVCEHSLYSLEMAIRCYEVAFQVYTADRYPLQYAKTLVALGHACGHFPPDQLLDGLTKAFRCYEAARQAYTTCVHTVTGAS